MSATLLFCPPVNLVIKPTHMPLLPTLLSFSNTSITYSGYLLKRSNKPYSLSPFNDQRGINHQSYAIPATSHDTTMSADSFTSSLQRPSAAISDAYRESESYNSDKTPPNPLLELDLKDSMTTDSIDNPVQSALELILAASFLSCDIPASTPRELSALSSSPPIRSSSTQPQDTTLITSSRPTSAPIMIGEHMYVPTRGVSILNQQTPTTQDLPNDYIDPKDGHIWRARYCILEDGILYFYQNIVTGNSSEAKIERRHKRSLGLADSQTSGHDIYSSLTKDMDALGKSPMPRSSLLKRLNEDEGSSSHNTNTVLWEKRVRLDTVGTVRAAEVDYGERSFELLAIRSENRGSSDSYDDLSLDDRLILRAASVEEMNEWMFQFHESCAAIMKQLVRSLKDEYPADLNFRRRDTIVSTTAMATSLKPHSNSCVDLIPAQNPLNSSLSHGHGRSGLHRRRKKNDQESSQTSDSSSYQNDASKSQLDNNCSLDLQSDRNEIIVTETTRFKKYIPPHLRQKTDATFSNVNIEYKTILEVNEPTKVFTRVNNSSALTLSLLAESETDNAREANTTSTYRKSRRGDIIIKLGGCADPDIIDGSIADKIYIPRGKSKVGKTSSQHFDRRYSDKINSAVMWEIGAVSECGIRDSNEDAYLIVNDLRNISVLETDSKAIDGIGVFSIFDGHCGNHTARFASERLPYILIDEAADLHNVESTKDKLQQLLEKSVSRLDSEFRKLCSLDGREWDSGATAIITLVLDNTMAIATLGDSNGVFCYSTLHDNVPLDKDASILLPDEYDESTSSDRLVLWKEVASVHSPSREDEKQRIESANGWITTEQEIPIAAQLHRMDFFDQDVLEILQRCFSERFVGGPNSRKGHAEPGRILHISRLCGELAVSRALGDFDFKAPLILNPSTHDNASSAIWRNSALFLPYPENHSQTFVGDLVSAIPDIALFDVGKQYDEFLILACDGLWDVIDCDDAVRIAKDLLYRRGWSAKSVVSAIYNEAALRNFLIQ